MTRNTHSMGDDFHFGTLTAERVLLDSDITNFGQGTQVEDVLQWVNDRLSLNEDGRHKVGFFSLEAVTLIPSFSIDAIIEAPQPHSFLMEARIPGMFANGGVIRTYAYIMPVFYIDAIIERTQPTAIIHQDFFTNQRINTWGHPDTMVGWDYTYTNDEAKENHDKLEYTQDVNDPNFPDYRGYYYDLLDTHYRTSIDDVGFYNKHIKIVMSTPQMSSFGEYQNKIYFGRGPDTYVAYNRRGSGSLGPDRLILVVDGVEITNQALGDSGGVFNTYGLPSGPVVIEAYVYNNHIKIRIYPEAWAPPSWDSATHGTTGPVFEWFGEFPPAEGVTEIRWDGRTKTGLGGDWGGPYTNYVHEWTVEALGAESVPMNAFIKPYFNVDALITRGGVWRVDAFILPTFRIDAEIVIRTFGGFTVDALIPDEVHGSFELSAFVKLTFSIDAQLFAPTKEGSFPMDATFVHTYGDDVPFASVIRDVDRAYSFTGDGIKKILKPPITFSVEAYKNSGSTFTVDALLALGIQIYGIKKETDLGDSFSIDAYYDLLEDRRSFYIDSYIVIEQTGSFLMDAWKKQTSDEWVHWDDFNNRTTTADLGVPSFRGSYSYHSESYRHTVSNGTWHHVENGGEHPTYFDGTDANIDRDVYMEWNRENNSGPSIGDMYVNLCGNVRLRNHLNSSIYYLQYGGVDTAQYTNVGTTGWTSFRFTIYGNGKHLAWKAWNRSLAEPELWQHWHDIDALGWTITNTKVSWDPRSESWFGQGDPPWDHYLDNMFMKVPTGAPYVLDIDASVRRLGIEGTIKMEAITGPPPFTVDSFIQPYFWMSAHIWAGTTFSMDAVIKKPDTIFGDYLITPNPPSDSAHWQQNGSGSVISVDQVRIAAGSSSNGSRKSKDTFGPLSGNAFPSQTELGYSTMTFSVEVIHRDNLAVGVYDASLGEYGSNHTGFYGFDISDYSNFVRDMINGADGSYSSFTDSLYTTPHEVVIEWRDVGSGLSQMKCWIDGVLRRTSATFITPTWDSFRIGFYTGYGIISGTNYVWYTPEMYSNHAVDGMWMDAWVAMGGKFQIGAHLKVSPQPIYLHAIQEAPHADAFTIDAARFDFGTQNRNATIDAFLAPGNDETRITQLGWLLMGDQMWGNVTPEREQGHFSIGAVIRLGAGFTMDATLDRGHFWIDALIILEGGSPLWSYENANTGDWLEGSTPTLELWEGDNR